MDLISLPRLIDFLNGCSASDFRADRVETFLRRHQLEPEQLLPFTYFQEESYGRNLVFKNQSFELLVLTWLPRQRTAIHDHAGQRCWMWMDTGSLTFRNYQVEDPELPPSPDGNPYTRGEGQAAYIDDGVGFHAIENSSSKPAVSLHLYAGPVPRCRVYNESTKHLEWVTLHYTTIFGEEAVVEIPPPAPESEEPLS